MRLRSLALFAVALLALWADAAPRRRAVGKSPSFDPSTPAGWLARNAYPLATADFIPYRGDLEPLRSVLGAANVVGIGDATHGTHEFYTMRLRVIDFAVREMNFDVVAIEAPFVLTNRIDAYVQGSAGDPRALLRELRALGYFFWDAEELVAVIEWLREYNAHRGDRKPVHIAGFDVFEPFAASQSVIAYLRDVDPPAAAVAEQEYSCITSTTLVISSGCAAAATRVYDALATRAATTPTFDDALHAARVVVQNKNATGDKRDASLAENALWLREHRGSSRKLLLWAHNTHLAKAANRYAGEQPMGKRLAAAIGNEYFALATLTAAGTFRQVDTRNGGDKISSFPPLAPNAYETFIRQRGVPFLLIPLRGALPQWLTTTAPYNSAAGSGAPGLIDSLPEQFDAAIFIDTTTPLEGLRAK